MKNPSGYCKNTKVYIADVTGFALIVYDYALNKSWKIKNPLVKIKFLSQNKLIFFYFFSSTLKLLTRDLQSPGNLLHLMMVCLEWRFHQNVTVDTTHTLKARDFFTSIVWLLEMKTQFL